MKKGKEYNKIRAKTHIERKIAIMKNNTSIALRDDLVTTFVIIDDFCKALELKEKAIGRNNSLTISEVAVISLIRVKYSIRNWKSLYNLIKDR